MFTGEYRHTVDDKGRIAVPAKFRAQLDGGAVVSRWIDACLAIHTRAGWDDARDEGRGPAHHRPGARHFQRSIFAGAFEVELDRQGRILLPRFLRDWASISTATPSSSVPAITPRSGRPPAGTTTAARWRPG